MLALYLGLFSFTEAAPLLINAQQRSLRTQPAYIRNNFAWINHWTHFDGMVISTPASLRVMAGTPLSAARIYDDFAPLRGLSFGHMKHNFALVEVERSTDFFDDWSVTIENFRNLARVLKLANLRGIAFDNEPYGCDPWNYPASCKYRDKTLEQYQAQARLVGRKITEAMAEAFPEIIVLTYIGPAASFQKTPHDAGGGGSGNQLLGPFCVGMVEGLSSPARFIDGGEIYHLRSTGDFEGSYQYRKYGIAADSCQYLPEYLRSLWPQKIEIGFGIYNRGHAEMNPAVLRTTLERALHRSDSVVWLYFEELDWNTPGGVPQDWIGAVRAAREL